MPYDRAGPRRSGSRSKAPLAEDKDNANDQWTVPNILQCKGKSFEEELKGLLRLVPVILNRALDAALEDTDMAPTLEELNSFSLASPELAVVAPRARQVRLADFVFEDAAYRPE